MAGGERNGNGGNEGRRQRDGSEGMGGLRTDESDIVVRTVMGENEGVGRGNVRERAFVGREAFDRGGRGASDRNGNGRIGEKARVWRQGDGRMT